MLDQNLHLNKDSRWLIGPNRCLKNTALGTNVEHASELSHWRVGNLEVFIHQFLDCHWSSPDFKTINFAIVACTHRACYQDFALALLSACNALPSGLCMATSSVSSRSLLKSYSQWAFLPFNFANCMHQNGIPTSHCSVFPLKKNSIVLIFLIHCISHLLTMFNVFLFH